MVLPDAMSDELRVLTHDFDPTARVEALHDLCPWEFKRDYPRVWDRIVEMVENDHVWVRGAVFHRLGDGMGDTLSDLAG